MLPFLIAFTLWALLHSLTAMRRTKAVARQWMGERPFAGLYRLLYNIFSFFTILPLFYVMWTAVPRTLLWEIPLPWSYGAQFLRLAGLVGLAVALWQTDIWDFVGLRQAVRFFHGQEEMTLPPKLVTGGMYAFVRHPLYFFSMLVLWFSPLMLLPTFLFNLLATGYFYAGSRVEERRLADFFGETYDAYRRRVPGLLPIPRFKG
ncbi:MAG: isoprenylcysteine carboxylmethyltransferase family protein [Chloroflexi bacterium]|nr:isoprenylcysteine carboxylmethyltransferase family protein [Chloroflexota bacterium]